MPVDPRILIVGLGNLLLGDDGVGVHVVRALPGRLPRSVTAVEVGTAVMDALHLVEWADKVLAIDAMQAGGPPGTVYAARICDLEVRPVRASLHELNLVAALHLLRRRPEILILGVEPETIALGMVLSPRVAAAVPAVVRHVERASSDWRAAAGLVHNSSHGPTRGRPFAVHRLPP
jgi:hydrogenase maturation protease